MISLFHTACDAEEILIAGEVLRSGQLVMGRQQERLAWEIGRYLGQTFGAVPCASGTDALILAINTLLRHRDRGGIIVPAMTFSATYEAVLRAGFTPILCDVEKESLTPSLEMVHRAFFSAVGSGISVVGLILVHLYGWPARHLLEIKDFCTQQELPLIEDAAQAFGATRHDIKVGNFGDAATFSFYPTKPFGGIGDGGCVYFASSDSADADHARAMRNHGRSVNGQTIAGFNSRLDEVNAAILRHRLQNYGANIEARHKVSGLYHRHGLKKLSIDRKGMGVPYVYPILVDPEDRQSLIDHMTLNEIQVGTHYDPPVSGLPYIMADCPNAKWAAKRIVTLPCHHMMTDGDAEKVCDAIRGHRGKD